MCVESLRLSVDGNGDQESEGDGAVLRELQRQPQLVGTKETTKVVNVALEKAGLSKRMISSGHSSQTTTSLDQRAGAAGSGTLSGAVIQPAKTGGAVSAGIEAISGVRDLINGDGAPRR